MDMVATEKRPLRIGYNGLALLLAALAILAFALVGRYEETRMYRAYNRITVGMDLANVEQMLGPGSRISENEVTRTHRGLIVDGVPASQPVVKGDVYYKWTGEVNGSYVVISFVENRVQEKYYWEWSL